MPADPTRPRARHVEPLLAVLLLLAGAGLAWRAAALGEVWTLTEVGIVVIAAGVVLGALPWFAGCLLGCLAASGAALAAIVAPEASRVEALVAAAEVAGVLLASAALAVVVRAGRVAAEAELDSLRDAAREHSVADPLTGVANGRGLDLVGQPMIENARREGQAVHCLMIDVDGLRALNDSAGRRAGDAVLVAVAEAVRSAIRSTDVVARRDGDAFIVMGPGTGVSPLEMERRVRAHLGTTAPVPRQQWPGRVSAGSSTLVPWDDGDLDSLVQRAEQDMSLRRALRRRSAPEQARPPAEGRTIVAATDDP